MINTMVIEPRMVLKSAILQLLKLRKTQTESKGNQNCTCLYAEKIKVMSSCQNPNRKLGISVGFLAQLLQKLRATSVDLAPHHCSISA